MPAVLLLPGILQRFMLLICSLRRVSLDDTCFLMPAPLFHAAAIDDFHDIICRCLMMPADADYIAADA